MDLAELDRRNEFAGGQERDQLHRSRSNGAWLSAVPHRLNNIELSWGEFWDNLRLRYGLMPQDNPVSCDSCGKKFSVEHAISCPNGDLVMEQHDDAAKEWGDLGFRALIPSALIYEPKSNSRTVQGEMNGAGVRQEGGTSNSGMDIV